jgi:hypothetical protein
MSWLPTSEFWRTRGRLSGALFLAVFVFCLAFITIVSLPNLIEIVMCAVLGSIGYLFVLGVFERTTRRRLSKPRPR